MEKFLHAEQCEQSGARKADKVLAFPSLKCLTPDPASVLEIGNQPRHVQPHDITSDRLQLPREKEMNRR